MYDVNPYMQTYKEILIAFDKKELEIHATGFDRESEWLLYCGREDAFHSLTDFLEQRIMGKSYDQEKQIEAYQEIATNNDGTCGAEIYQFVCGKI